MIKVSTEGAIYVESDPQRLFLREYLKNKSTGIRMRLKVMELVPTTTLSPHNWDRVDVSREIVQEIFKGNSHTREQINTLSYYVTILIHQDKLKERLYSSLPSFIYRSECPVLEELLKTYLEVKGHWGYFFIEDLARQIERLIRNSSIPLTVNIFGKHVNDLPETVILSLAERWRETIVEDVDHYFLENETLPSIYYKKGNLLFNVFLAGITRGRATPEEEPELFKIPDLRREYSKLLEFRRNPDSKYNVVGKYRKLQQKEFLKPNNY